MTLANTDLSVLNSRNAMVDQIDQIDQAARVHL